MHVLYPLSHQQNACYIFFILENSDSECFIEDNSKFEPYGFEFEILR